MNDGKKKKFTPLYKFEKGEAAEKNLLTSDIKSAHTEDCNFTHAVKGQLLAVI